MKKILAAASFGGHWVQLMRLKPLLDQYDTAYASTNSELELALGSRDRFFLIHDAAADTKIRLLISFLEALLIVIRLRPSVVISTGAAPGLALIVWGRIFGAKTIWIDSVANAEHPSRSGMLAKRWSSVWISQWEDVAQRYGASYWGRVI